MVWNHTEGGGQVVHHALDIQKARVGILQTDLKNKKHRVGQGIVVELCVNDGFDGIWRTQKKILVIFVVVFRHETPGRMETVSVQDACALNVGVPRRLGGGVFSWRCMQAVVVVVDRRPRIDTGSMSGGKRYSSLGFHRHRLRFTLWIV